MNFRSIRDLGNLVRENLDAIAGDIDLVVAASRNGMIPASMIALTRNLPLTDIEGLRAQRLFRRQGRRAMEDHVWPAGHVLVVDDSVTSGDSLAALRAGLADLPAPTRVSYLTAYGTSPGAEAADIVLETLPAPHIFEWTLFHDPVLGAACVDIDGVLCVDPKPQQNDDGPAYRAFIRNAEPLFLPRVPVACLVTSRREIFRPETEDWLQRHGVRYSELVMLNETAGDRRRFGLHAKHKADVYRRKGAAAAIFVESDLGQAEAIAELSGKPVLSIKGMRLFASNRGFRRPRPAPRRGRGLLKRIGLG